MDLIREIEQLLADRCKTTDDLGNLCFPAGVRDGLPEAPCTESLGGVFSDEAQAFTNYRSDVNFDSLDFLDRWLADLQLKMMETADGEMRALIFDHVWVLGAYSSECRRRGDQGLGLQIFKEAFEVGKHWPRSWAFGSLLRRLPALIDQDESDLAIMVLLHAQDIFRLTDPFQAAFTLISLAALRSRKNNEWEAVESHGLEAVLAADNIFGELSEADLLRRLGYIHQAGAQLQLGKFEALSKTVDLIPELPGVTGHDIFVAGLMRGAMHWEFGDVEAARKIYRRELDRVSVRFPDLRVCVFYYWAFMESHIGDPRRAHGLLVRGAGDVKGNPSYRDGLGRILDGATTFEALSAYLVTFAEVSPMTPPRTMELQSAA